MQTSEWLARIADWLRRDSLDGELAEELRFHRQQLERDARSGGVNDNDVAAHARRRLGNETAVREATRDRWSLPWIEHVHQDVRYALRGLRRAPGFTATVAVTLGLGIGANVAVFGVVDELMLRPLPYLIDPPSVSRVYLQTTPRGQTFTNTVFPFARYLDLKNGTTSFSRYAAFSEQIMAIGSGDDAREENTSGVSSSFFSFFNAIPERGRFFTAAEDSASANTDVVVLSYATWQARYGARDVIGQPLQVGKRSYTIVGIAPKGFIGASPSLSPSVFLPIASFALNEGGAEGKTYQTRYNWDFAQVLIRRKPGVSAEVASADLTRAYVASRDAQRLINPAVAQANVAHPRGIAGPIKLAAGPGAGLEARTLLWVSGVAVIVLMIACANVTNLVLARVLQRKREFALRLALGVSRRRLLGQLLTENVLLAGIGCATALIIAQWGGAAFRGFALTTDDGNAGIANGRTLTAAALVALVAALLTSVAPVMLAAKANLATMIRGGAREGTYQRSRVRSTLLVAQGALSVMLLVGAGLFIQSLNNAKNVQLGYDSSSVLLAFPNLRGARLDSASEVAFNRRLLVVAQQLPQVKSAARVNSRMFSTNSELVFVDGMDSTQQLGRFVIQYATPEYFATMNTRILRGRSFTEADRAGAPRVTVVSESMGKTLWPGNDPIGQCLRISENTSPCTTVVGVAEDAAFTGLQGDKRFAQYVPLEQFDPRIGHNIVLRLRSGDASGGLEAVRRELQRVMPGQGYITVRPVEEFLATQRRSWLLGAAMFATFGILALLVAAVGLYGVITYTVTQRMQELSVRVALGAQGRDIARLVVGQSFSFAIAGVALGLAAALAASRWLQPLLFEQSARDPRTYAVIGFTVLAVSVAASAMPAFRASRANPNDALRSG